LKKKIISYAVCLFGLICILSPTFAQNNSFFPKLFIDGLQNYFYVYYSRSETGEAAVSQEQVLKDIKEMTLKYCDGIDKEGLAGKDNLDDLTNFLDKYLNNYGKSINIFTVEGSSIVNCWLGDLAEEKIEKRNIWNKEIEFYSKGIDNLNIRDFTYYLNKGKESLQVGTRGEVIYYNLESYSIHANTIWDFFIDRIKENRYKRYDPSRVNRLRRRLYYRIWGGLYSASIKEKENLNDAKAQFIDKVAAVLKENSIFHEAGHVFVNRYLKLKDSSEEEMFAFLTELRYGPMPYDSLELIISAGYQSSMDNYKLAGREIISYFASYIKRKEDGEGLSRIPVDRIHSICDDIYKQRF